MVSGRADASKRTELVALSLATMRCCSESSCVNFFVSWAVMDSERKSFVMSLRVGCA